MLTNQKYYLQRKSQYRSLYICKNDNNDKDEVQIEFKCFGKISRLRRGQKPWPHPFPVLALPPKLLQSLALAQNQAPGIWEPVLSSYRGSLEAHLACTVGIGGLGTLSLAVVWNPPKLPESGWKKHSFTSYGSCSYLYWLCGECCSKLASSASTKVEPWCRLLSSFRWLACLLSLSRPHLTQYLPISMSK